MTMPGQVPRESMSTGVSARATLAVEAAPDTLSNVQLSTLDRLRDVETLLDQIGVAFHGESMAREIKDQNKTPAGNYQLAMECRTRAIRIQEMAQQILQGL